MAHAATEPTTTRAGGHKIFASTVAEDIDGIVRMVDAVDTLWESVRENIAVSCNGDPDRGTYGPVGGLDWALSELGNAIYRMRTKVEETEVKP